MIKRRRAEKVVFSLESQTNNHTKDSNDATQITQNQLERTGLGENQTVLKNIPRRETRVIAKKVHERSDFNQFRTINPEQYHSENLLMGKSVGSTEETCTDDSTYSQGQEEEKQKLAINQPKRRVNALKRQKNNQSKRIFKHKFKELDKEHLIAHLWAKRVCHQRRMNHPQILSDLSNPEKVNISTNPPNCCPLLRMFQLQSINNDPSKSIIKVSFNYKDSDRSTHLSSDALNQGQSSLDENGNNSHETLSQGINETRQSRERSNLSQEPYAEGNPLRNYYNDPMRESRIDHEVESSFSQYSLENYVEPLIDYTGSVSQQNSNDNQEKQLGSQQ